MSPPKWHDIVQLILKEKLMDLVSEHPYWLMRNGIPYTYPSLQKNIKADIAIIGTGISGSLVAYYLGKAGLSVVQVDRRHAAMGSTVASTSLLQYEIDQPIRELAKNVGMDVAVRSYKLCRDSIYQLKDICTQLKCDPNFKLRPSLQYASFKKDIAPLEEEYELRKANGFDVRMLSKSTLREKFGLEADSAIFSADGGQIDAYLASHEILQASSKMGNRVYDNTHVTDIEYSKNEVVLHTDTGNRIDAKKLVIACGYESGKYLPEKVAELYSTYALVTEPIDKRKLWYKRALIWETAQPYMYYRITDDNRILMGGKDDEFYNPEKRDGSIRKKARQLEKSFRKRFPEIDIRTDFRWAGTFAGTKDALPYIGGISSRPNTYFALGFGGNGITFSVIAAQIIRDMICGNKNADAEMFRFGR